MDTIRSKVPQNYHAHKEQGFYNHILLLNDAFSFQQHALQRQNRDHSVHLPEQFRTEVYIFMRDNTAMVRDRITEQENMKRNKFFYVVSSFTMLHKHKQSKRKVPYSSPL